MLKGIPTPEHLARLYFELEKIGASCVGKCSPWPYRPRSPEELLCLACEMSRHDPRLITILAKLLAEHCFLFHPMKIRRLYPQMDTPQTIAVIAEFVLKHAHGDDEPQFFCDHLQRGLRPVPLQFYFHHLYTPGGHLAKRATETPLAEYKRWGFLACEAPIFDDQGRVPTGTLDAQARRNVLTTLLAGKKEIRMADYLAACRGAISRQQALLDLKQSGLVKSVGHGKGARWRVKSPAFSIASP